MPAGIKIKNTAYIYFDFNPAVVTNTTENILVEKFHISNVSEENEIKINAFPNPSDGIYRLSDIVTKADLYDAQGRYVNSYHHTDIINVEEAQAGVYFLKIYKDESVDVISLVLIK